MQWPADANVVSADYLITFKEDMDMEPTLLDPEETEPLLADDQGEQAPKDKWGPWFCLVYFFN